MAQTEFKSLAGKFLIAMPGMGDARFEKTVIYMCAHTEEGAMGFVINKPLPSPTLQEFFDQLEIFSSEEDIVVPEPFASQSMHVGGPVEPGRGFVLHTNEFESETTLEVSDGVCLTATLEILRKIAVGTGPEKCLIALGYSGWASGQLEEEISANGWLTCDAMKSIIFDEADAAKYDRALAEMGVDSRLLSRDVGHA